MGEYGGTEAYAEKNSNSLWVVFFIVTVLIQLVFMTLLIAIMSESFARLSSMTGSSTLQSLCQTMEDNAFLVDIEKEFENDRYILWIGSEGNRK